MSFFAPLFKPVAYLSLPLFLLHTASNRSPLARYYIRLGLYLSSLGVASIWGAISSIGMTLLGRRLDTNWIVARFFYHLASRAVGIEIELEGEEHLANRPAIMVGNHQSMLDILMLGRMFPKQAAMTAKKQLQWTPFFGQFLTLSGAVFIDRGNNARAVKAVADAGEKMKAQGTSIWIFPEGTRTNQEKIDLRPFKKGAFHMAVQAGVPIIPVVCENYWHLYRSGRFEGGKLKVRILPPVPTTGLTASDVSDLSVKVREQMLETLRELSGVKQEESPMKPAVTAPPPPPAEAPAALGTSPDPPIKSEEPEQQEQPESSSAERSKPAVSLSIDTSSVKRDGSDQGTETEEDEGMVLVGRPTDP